MIGPLRRRVETRLRELERRDPDGTIATWRWMWRTLTRTSRSPWRLRLRFTAMMIGDAALLAAWWLFRSPLVVARQAPAKGVAAVVGIAAISGLLWIDTRDHSPRLDLADIRLEGEAIQLMGQRVSLDDLRRIAEARRIGIAHIHIAPEVTTGQVMAVQTVLSETIPGPARIRFSEWTPLSRVP